jgi:hypothetical protein
MDKLALNVEELEQRIAPSLLYTNPGNNNPGENNTNLPGNQPKDGDGGGNPGTNNPGENNTLNPGNETP